MVSYFRLASMLFFIQLALAINLGGFDNNNTGTTTGTNTGTSATTKSTEIVASTTNKGSSITDSTNTGTSVTAILIDSTDTTLQTSAKTATASTSQSYNQWGFTGSQRSWAETTTSGSSSTSASGSSSGSSASSTLSKALSSSSAGAVPEAHFNPSNWAIVPLVALGALGIL